MTKIDALSQTLLNFMAYRGIDLDTDTAEGLRELVAAFYGRSLGKVQFIKAIRDTSRPTYTNDLVFRDTSVNAEVAKLFENVAVPYVESGTARMSLLEAKVFADIVEINRDGPSDAQVSESLGRVRKAFAAETKIGAMLRGDIEGDEDPVYTADDYADAIADLRFEDPITAPLAPMPPVERRDYDRARGYLADYCGDGIERYNAVGDDYRCICACQELMHRYEREQDLRLTCF